MKSRSSIFDESPSVEGPDYVALVIEWDELADDPPQLAPTVVARREPTTLPCCQARRGRDGRNGSAHALSGTRVISGSTLHGNPSLCRLNPNRRDCVERRASIPFPRAIRPPGARAALHRRSRRCVPPSCCPNSPARGCGSASRWAPAPWSCCCRLSKACVASAHAERSILTAWPADTTKPSQPSIRRRTASSSPSASASPEAEGRPLTRRATLQKSRASHVSAGPSQICGTHAPRSRRCSIGEKLAAAISPPQRRTRAIGSFTRAQQLRRGEPPRPSRTLARHDDLAALAGPASIPIRARCSGGSRSAGCEAVAFGTRDVVGHARR